MPRPIKLLWASVLQFAFSVGLLAGFILFVSFVAATSVAELDLGGKSLPADWEAAYLNHGKFLRGYLIENHPLAFAMTIVLLVGSFAGLWLMSRHIKARAETGADPRTRMDNLVNAAELAAAIAIGIVVYKLLFIGTLPA